MGRGRKDTLCQIREEQKAGFISYRTPKNHDVVAHGQSKHKSKVKDIPSETQTGMEMQMQMHYTMDVGEEGGESKVE